MRKQDLLDLIGDLPDEVDTESLMHRLYLMEKIERSERAAELGRVHSHEEVVRQVSQWFK